MLVTGTRSDWPGEAMLPVPCDLARGSPIRSELAGKPVCFNRMDDFRSLYPEYAALTDRQIIVATYERVGVPVRGQYTPIWNALSLALLPPLVLGMLAMALAWVIRGFQPNSRDKSSQP